MSADALVLMAAIAGPELDFRIREYENGTRELSKENVLKDLKAATSLASLLSLELERMTV